MQISSTSTFVDPALEIVGGLSRAQVSYSAIQSGYRLLHMTHADAGTIIDKEAANEMLKEHHSEFNADIPFYGHQYFQNKNQAGHHTSASRTSTKEDLLRHGCLQSVPVSCSCC